MIEDGLRIDKYGTKQWYQDGELHQVDGPAIIWTDGSEYWYKHGLLHRDNGPAAIYSSGGKEWWYKGKLLVITSEVISELLEVVVG